MHPTLPRILPGWSAVACPTAALLARFGGKPRRTAIPEDFYPDQSHDQQHLAEPAGCRQRRHPGRAEGVAGQAGRIKSAGLCGQSCGRVCNSSPLIAVGSTLPGRATFQRIACWSVTRSLRPFGDKPRQCGAACRIRKLPLGHATLHRAGAALVFRTKSLLFRTAAPSLVHSPPHIASRSATSLL